MNVKRKLAVTGVTVLGLAGLGAGVAAAQTADSSSKPAAPMVAPVPATPPTPAPTPDPAASGPQVGDQNAPDTPSASGAETETEKATPEEPGDASLPGGGHADPAGQNVDHQFDGVE